MTAEDELLEWLKDRRLAAGLGQDDVDRLSTQRGTRISQSYLSQIERGIKPLSAMGAERMNVLRELYKVSPEEWSRRTGLGIVMPTDAERRGWVMPPDEQEDLQALPEALEEAIRIYGTGKHADMGSDAWRRVYVNSDFREEPDTPEEWFAIYLRLKDVFKPR